MGLMNDKDHVVQLLIDEDVLAGEELGCHPCVCTSSLKMKTADVINRFLPATGHEFILINAFHCRSTGLANAISETFAISKTATNCVREYKTVHLDGEAVY